MERELLSRLVSVSLLISNGVARKVASFCEP